MMDAALDLHQAVFKSLAAGPEILSVLGGPKIFDRVPERAVLPYVVLGRSTVSDWSTATEGGETIVFFVHTWSKASDRVESHRLQNAIKQVLEKTPPALVDHHLIHLRFQLTETRRDRTAGHFHSVLRFRAVTEPKIPNQS